MLDGLNVPSKHCCITTKDKEDLTQLSQLFLHLVIQNYLFFFIISFSSEVPFSKLKIIQAHDKIQILTISPTFSESLCTHTFISLFISLNTAFLLFVSNEQTKEFSFFLSNPKLKIMHSYYGSIRLPPFLLKALLSIYSTLWLISQTEIMRIPQDKFPRDGNAAV